MDSVLAWLVGTKAQIILSGALGGVVRWLTLREKIGTGAISVVVGGICAMYLGPIVEPLLDPIISLTKIEAGARASFAGFVIGLTGITIAGFVIDFITERRLTVARKKEEGQIDEARTGGS